MRAGACVCVPSHTRRVISVTSLWIKSSRNRRVSAVVSISSASWVQGTRWHADHFLSVDSGGFNHSSHQVAACARCNEHEKREMPWVDFLRHKCGGDEEAFERRRHVSDAHRDIWSCEVETVAQRLTRRGKN